MTIRCRCQSCRAKFDAPQKFAGREVKCPKCGETFIVQPTRKKKRPTANSPAQSTQDATGSGDSSIDPSSTDSVVFSQVSTVDLVDFVPQPPATNDEPGGAAHTDPPEEDIPVFPQVETSAAAATSSNEAPASETVPPPPGQPTGEQTVEAPPAAPRRIKPPPPPPSNAPMMFAALLTFVAAAALVVGVYFIVNPPGGGNAVAITQPKLAFVWPEATRQDAEIFINGRRMILPARGDVEYTLQPGAYEVRLARAGFRTIEARVELQKGFIREFEPIWEVDQRAAVATSAADPPSTAIKPAMPPRSVRAPRGYTGWLQNYEEAKTAAAAGNKNLLIAFVNSSSPQSRMMASTVFSKPAFREAAAEKYVLLVIDLPESRADFARVADPVQNERLLREFDIVQFPTFIFADSEGKPFAFEPSVWELTDLARFEAQRQKRDELFAAVDAATGDAKLSAFVDAADFLFKHQISRYYKNRGEEWLTLAGMHDASNAKGYLEKAFFVYWSSHIEVPDKPHRLPRLLVRFNEWKQQHAFKDARLTLNFYSIAATAMLDIGNPQGARDYLQEAQTLFTTNSAYQRQVKQLLAASDDLKG